MNIVFVNDLQWLQ